MPGGALTVTSPSRDSGGLPSDNCGRSGWASATIVKVRGARRRTCNGGIAVVLMMKLLRLELKVDMRYVFDGHGH